MRIGLTPRNLTGWQGGRELFELMASGLRVAGAPHDRIEIALAPGQDRPAWRLLRRLKRGALAVAGRDSPDPEQTADFFSGLGMPMTRDGAEAFDVVGPFGAVPRGLGAPWIGYIPDLQHCRLPEMFPAHERASRNRTMRALLAQAPVIVVNAAAVAVDLRQYFSPPRGEIVVLPFAACARPEWFAGPVPPSRPYFLCSNQFWKHKNHGVVIEAARLARQAGSPLRLVFTGHAGDYRHPGHAADLLRRIEAAGVARDIEIRGLVPKAEQIRLMRGAAAVVQPSLFEGGPGGGAIYNAIALGRPTVVSDIPVNREIGGLVTRFFDPADPADLLDKLRAIEACPPLTEDPEMLLREGGERLLHFGTVLRRAFATAAAGRLSSADR